LKNFPEFLWILFLVVLQKDEVYRMETW
jgi:hypothetical protein